MSYRIRIVNAEQTIDCAERTTILSAAKVTGRLRSGLSVGALAALHLLQAVVFTFAATQRAMEPTCERKHEGVK